MNWYKIAQSLTSIYELLEEGVESVPSDEVLYDYIGPEDLHTQLEIKTVSNPETLLTSRGDMTVFDSFSQFANDESKKLVEYYSKHKPLNDIIVLKGNQVLDGNHRVVASILGGWKLRAIDIDELV